MGSGVVVMFDARDCSESGSSNCAITSRIDSGRLSMSTSSTSSPSIGATRPCSLAGRPIQKSRPSGPATFSAKNVPRLRPVIRRTTSPTSQP